MPENPNQSPVDDLKNKVSKVSNEKKWAMCCYIPFFNIVVCVLASIRMINNKFVLYHARQGLILFAFWLVTLVVGLISSTLSLMLLGVVFLLHVVGLIAASKAQTTKTPVVTGLVDKIPEDYLFKKLTGKTPEKNIENNKSAEKPVQKATPATPPATENKEANPSNNTK